MVGVFFSSVHFNSIQFSTDQFNALVTHEEDMSYSFVNSHDRVIISYRCGHRLVFPLSQFQAQINAGVVSGRGCKLESMPDITCESKKTMK